MWTNATFCNVNWRYFQQQCVTIAGICGAVCLSDVLMVGPSPLLILVF